MEYDIEDIVKRKFTLNFDGRSFPIDDLSVTQQTAEYRLKAKLNGKVAPHLSKAMLGPSTEFADVELISEPIHIHTNLTSMMEKPTSIELNLTVTQIDL